MCGRVGVGDPVVTESLAAVPVVKELGEAGPLGDVGPPVFLISASLIGRSLQLRPCKSGLPLSALRSFAAQYDMGGRFL